VGGAAAAGVVMAANANVNTNADARAIGGQTAAAAAGPKGSVCVIVNAWWTATRV
jgi:hypothetical protein